MILYVFRCDFDYNTADLNFANVREVEVRETPKMYISVNGENFFNFASRVYKSAENALLKSSHMYYMYSTNPSTVPFKKAVEEDLSKHIDNLSNTLNVLNDRLANFSNTTFEVSYTKEWYKQ